MRSLVLLPEAVVVAGAVGLLFLGRPGVMRRSQRRYLPIAATIVALAALGIELWVGAVLSTFFGGALVQDRFALFAKAAALLAAAAAIAVTDWSAEESPSVGLAMPLLAAFGVMVAASAGDLVGLWAGIELAAVGGVVVVATRRPDLGVRLLVSGAVGTSLLLAGLAYVYATVGTADLVGLRQALQGEPATLPLALPVLLLFGGLAVRAGWAPYQFARVPVALGASPLGTGIVVGLVAMAAVTVGIKLTAVLSFRPELFASGLAVVAGVAMVGGGAAALAARSPRARIVYLAVGQAGWLAAGLATDFRAGLGATLFLLGAFGIAATAGPASLGALEGGEAALAGMGSLRPARAAALAIAALSLAGTPPLAGFFGEFAVAASLAQSGQFALLALGLLGAVLSQAAALGTVRAVYFQSLPDEARRGAIPAWTRFSSAGAVGLCLVIMAYGVFASPIMGLADQGAKALGLR